MCIRDRSYSISHKSVIRQSKTDSDGGIHLLHQFRICLLYTSPNDNPSQTPIVRWRSAAQLLYTNWLNYYVYQTTPYDLEHIVGKEDAQ